MTETQAFVEISSRSAAELAEKYLALWNEPDADRRRRMIAELWTEDGRHILQSPQEIRVIAAPRARADGDPRGTGIRGDRGSRGERVRALGRLRGAQLPGRDDAERLGDVVKFTGRRSPITARCSVSGSTSSSSPGTAGSSATTHSSSLRRDGTGATART